MAAKGLFLSFEGIDGAGKSSHIEALADAFRAAGRSVVLTREPGGTPLAEKIRTLALHEPMDALTEALLMFAARRDHLTQVIVPALARGAVVLCDRFTDATFAYQGAGRGFDWQALNLLEQLVQAQPDGSLREPSLTLWFDLSTEEAARRLAGARGPDRFESQPQAFFDAVRSGYAKRQHAAPERMARINSDLPREQVKAQIIDVLRERGWLAEVSINLLPPENGRQAIDTPISDCPDAVQQTRGGR